MKIKQILNSLWWKHKCFWGNRYRVIKDGKTIENLLIYHKKIYILKLKKLISFLKLLTS